MSCKCLSVVCGRVRAPQTTLKRLEKDCKSQQNGVCSLNRNACFSLISGIADAGGLMYRS